MTDTSTDNSIRLAKHVADTRPCSRREAEQYIEGGYVTVDGVVIEEAGARVAPGQLVVVADDANLQEILPVTILLHKPAGYNAGIGKDGLPALTLVGPDTLAPAAPPVRATRFLKRHLHKQELTNPIDTKASGLVVFTQDFRVARTLVENSARVEQEIIVEVSGDIVENGLALLNHGLPFNGKPLAPIKVSWQNENRLRFALKDPKPGQLEHMCKMVGLSVVSIKRLRIGRIGMSGLPAGQWRYLQDFERF